ncbi:fatty acid-binding protein isoform X2 [Megachile rotundata]|uniref:fatty acid-binding protein isoform X2 n=1 Tax=Megachile rotundata TaxID=143995 RepID=UPI000615057B|nr:PREDICTED: fatty acid-binding protein, intestinal-like [Megachile rotundata]
MTQNKFHVIKITLNTGTIEIVEAKSLEQHPEKLNVTSVEHYRLGQEMSSIVGTYQHERNENLDEYFKAVGVPYIARKMMSMTSPRLEISNDGDKWTIRTISMIRTVEIVFTPGEEYEEHMPSGVTLKNVTTMEGDSIVTHSVGPDNTKVVRKYDVTEDGLVLTMTHEKSGQVAKRYFKRIP